MLVWRVAIGGQGIVWNDRWVGRGSVRWTHVMAVGEPHMTRLPFRRMWQAYRLIRVRIITDRGRVDLYTEIFPGRGRGPYEAVAEHAGLTDTITLSGREFRCRRGWSPEEFWRQVAHGR